MEHILAAWTLISIGIAAASLGAGIGIGYLIGSSRPTPRHVRPRSRRRPTYLTGKQPVAHRTTAPTKVFARTAEGVRR